MEELGKVTSVDLTIQPKNPKDSIFIQIGGKSNIKKARITVALNE